MTSSRRGKSCARMMSRYARRDESSVERKPPPVQENEEREVQRRKGAREEGRRAEAISPAVAVVEV